MTSILKAFPGTDIYWGLNRMIRWTNEASKCVKASITRQSNSYRSAVTSKVIKNSFDIVILTNATYKHNIPLLNTQIFEEAGVH